MSNISDLVTTYVKTTCLKKGKEPSLYYLTQYANLRDTAENRASQLLKKIRNREKKFLEKFTEILEVLVVVVARLPIIRDLIRDIKMLFPSGSTMGLPPGSDYY